MHGFSTAPGQLLDDLLCYEAEYKTAMQAEQAIVGNVSRVGFVDASKRMYLVAQQQTLTEKIRRNRILLACAKK